MEPELPADATSRVELAASDLESDVEHAVTSAMPSGPSSPSPSGFSAGVVAAPNVVHALAGLASLPDVPLDDHPDVYQRVHQVLQATLAGIDDA